MAEQITKIGATRIKGGSQLGDFLDAHTAKVLGVKTRSMEQAQRAVRRTSRLQAELLEIERQMKGGK